MAELMPAPPVDDRGAEPALRRHLSILRRRKWIVLQAVIVVPLAAVVVTLHEQPQYRATASVLLDTNTIGASASDATPDRVSTTAAGLAALPIVARGALRSLPGSGLTVASFLARAHATARPDSDLLDFAVTDPSPGRAAALATAYARSFIAVQRRLWSTVLGSRARNSTGAAGTPAAGGLPVAVLVRPADRGVQVAPRPTRNVVFGIVLGLVGGIGLAYLRELLNTRVRDVDEVTRALGRPLLGVARWLGGRAADGLALQTDPFGRSAESYRIIRANLEFANVDRDAQVLLFTGAVDGEGRSTIVANIALASALAGKDVILADLHLRHPALDRLFALQGRAGLTDVALGHVPLEAALSPISLRDEAPFGAEEGGSLQVLPSGPSPIDTGEFVATRAVRTVVEELRGQAELVLIDAPPLLPIGDALTLSGVADALVVVVNLDLATRPMLRELRRVLDACPTPTLGCITASASSGQHDSYGGYYHERSAVDARLSRTRA